MRWSQRCRRTCRTTGHRRADGAGPESGTHGCGGPGKTAMDRCFCAGHLPFGRESPLSVPGRTPPTPRKKRKGARKGGKERKGGQGADEVGGSAGRWSGRAGPGGRGAGPGLSSRAPGVRRREPGAGAEAARSRYSGPASSGWPGRGGGLVPGGLVRDGLVRDGLARGRACRAGLPACREWRRSSPVPAIGPATSGAAQG